MGDKDGHTDMPCIMLMQAGAGQLESDLTAEFRVIEALNDTDVPSPRAPCGSMPTAAAWARRL